MRGDKWRKIVINAVSGLAVLCFLAASCSSDKTATVFHVSPDGDDLRSGTADAPFRTVERAQEAVRAYRQAGGSLPSGGVVVYLHGGVYPLRRTLRFTQEDGGKEGAPVIYRACPGEEVCFTGGHDNIVTNNVFIDCEASIHLDARGVNWASYYMKEDVNMEMFRKLKAVNPDRPPYSERYPALARLPGLNPGQPKGNVFRSNLSYGGRWRDIEQDVDEVTIEDNYILREIPSGIDADAGKLYPEDESILERINFQKIPFDSIGLYEDVYRKK
jgi:hypothetical protein